MRAGALLEPIRIAGLVIVTLLLLGASAAVSPDAGQASLEPLIDGCTQNADGWMCPLTVTLQGSGTVTSDDGLINCGTDCDESYFYNSETPQSVLLTATAASGWRFSSWLGCNSPDGDVCSVTMDHAKPVTAVFVRTTYRLTVTVAGTGTGRVTGSGIDCPGTCVVDFRPGSAVQLTAAPTAPSTWGGWGGDCSGTSTSCTVTMTADRNVTATFNAVRTLRVSVSGTGRVTGSGIDCPGDCEQQYSDGASVQLTAAPTAPSTWGGWGGACSESTSTSCTVAMTADRSVTATFGGPVRTLRVSVSGTGKVTGAGVDCPGDCDQQYADGAAVQLTASPGAGMATSWGGACTGTGTTCSLTMNADRSVSATFSAIVIPVGTRRLTVTVSGSGRVSGRGIDCPSDCTEDYEAGTVVSLTAAPAAGWTVEWSGACGGSSPTCGVTMTESRAAVATFVKAAPRAPVIDEELDPLPARPPPTVEQVIVKVDGTGKVVSSTADRVTAGATAVPRINCGSLGGAPSFDCYGEYAPGQPLTLTARPASGYVFTRWSGACAGTAPTCRVVARDARTVTAVFAQTGKGAAVAAVLTRPRLRVRWRSSVGDGSLVVRGSTSVPATVRVDMRRPGGGPLATLRLKLGGGSFRQTLALRRGALAGNAKLFPGGFTVALTGRAGRLKLPLQIQTIAIPAPAEGVVRKAFRSASENGSEVARLPAGAKEAWANFRFETQPRLNQNLSVRWFWPDGRMVGEVRKSNRPVISSYLRLETGLGNGQWVAELRAGNRVVQRLSVRVGP